MIYLQREKDEGLSYEAKLIYQQCVLNRLKVQYVTNEDIKAGILDKGNCDLVVGSVEALTSAFSALGYSIPKSNYYPECLQKFLHRNVWRGSVSEVRGLILAERPIFAKSLDWKKLTGKVFDPISGWNELEPLDGNMQLWLSDPVTFLSEYRVYVRDFQVIASTWYWGDDSVDIDMSVIENAISVLKDDKNAPCAFAIDWGRLSTGQVALIEMNDGWSIGAYSGISSKEYFDFLTSRWREISNAKSN